MSGTAEAPTLAQLLDRAMEELGRACKDGGRIRMSIPVQPTDTDVVIAEALRAAKESLGSGGARALREAATMARNLLMNFNLPVGEGRKLQEITLDALNAALAASSGTPEREIK